MYRLRERNEKGVHFRYIMLGEEPRSEGPGRGWVGQNLKTKRRLAEQGEWE